MSTWSWNRPSNAIFMVPLVQKISSQFCDRMTCIVQNMIEKPEDRQIVKENCISMVQCKAIKQLELIEQKKFDDEDIQVSQLICIINIFLVRRVVVVV